MAEEKPETQVVKIPSLIEQRKLRAARKQKLREVGMTLKQLDTTLQSRQPSEEEDDPFTSMYDKYKLLEPTYAFSTLYRVYEESDALQECVDAMIQNVDGFGFQLLYLGDDTDGSKDSPKAQKQKTKCESFFDYANETQSWRTIRKLMRVDLEALGNGAFEVVRNNAGKAQLVYHLPFKQIRMSRYDGSAVTVPVTLKRDGEMIKIKVKKYFRKYAYVSSTTGKKLRWFKAFGDPRPMNALTGDYKKTGPQASELLHFKLPFAGYSYGMPRWIGCILDVMGRRSAQYVNWDVLESQGIPPMAIMVSGGVLTDESFDELEEMIRGLRGPEKWNRILILEANVETVGMEEKNTAKLELKNLSDFRKEDLMFDKYLMSTEKTVRHRYRLPPLYVGGAETFTYATAKAAQTIAEEQVFIPEREGFDEEVNRKLVLPELDVDLWKYVSKGPRAISSDELSKGVRAFVTAGAVTVNHAVDLANRAFGLEMSKYKDKWADYPINLVLELVKSGKIKGMEEVSDGNVEAAPPVAGGPPVAGELPPPAGQQRLLPVKVLKSDMFSKEEKRIYKKLVFLQDAIDRGLDTGEIAEEDLEEASL
jgi:PBSX family phage portal protein